MEPTTVDKLTDTEVYKRILKVMKDISPNGLLPENVTLKTRPMEDLDIDSIHAVNLLLGLEDAFGISIDDGAFAMNETVGDIVELVKGKLASSAN